MPWLGFYILACVVITVILIIINWKMSYKFASLITKAIVAISFIITLYLINFQFMIELDIYTVGLIVFITIIFQFIIVLVNVYMPYAKNKEDIKIIKKTINNLLCFLIMTIILSTFLMYLLFFRF